MTALIVIPARYASTRFPAKPLARETGKFLIQHVVEQARKIADAHVVVATDDQRIFDAIASFGGTPVMTSDKHESGTDRIAEVIQKPEFSRPDIIVNIQGDEPEFDPATIQSMIEALKENRDAGMATAATPFTNPADVLNPNMVKVVLDAGNFALYFSRSPIPFHRDKNEPSPPYLKHLGLYAYRRQALRILAASPVCDLEKSEKLEQLRALYMGMKIHVTITNHAPHGIDTPEDYAAFVRRYNGTGGTIT